MMDLLSDAILKQQIDLLRVEAGVVQRVIKLLAVLQRELTARLRSADLTTFSRTRMEAMLRQANKAINGYYGLAKDLVENTLTGIGESAVQHMLRTMNGLLAGAEAKLPTTRFLSQLASNILIQGSPASTWWSRQAANVAFRFASTVRLGVLQGQTTEQIVARVTGSARTGAPGVMDIARRDARALVHTSIQTVANAARLDTFKANDDVVECLVWLATLDRSTCPVCAPRDLHEYALVEPHDPLDGGPPWGAGPAAIHFSCRCVVSLKMKKLKGLRLPIGQRASDQGPVKGDTSFARFLNRMGNEYQDDVLGPGRAQLWRDKKLTLEQLLDLSGRPMSLAALREKYG